MLSAAGRQTRVWLIVRRAIGSVLVLSAVLMVLGLCCGLRTSIAHALVGWDNTLSGRPNVVRWSPSGSLGIVSVSDRGAMFWPADAEAGPGPAVENACVYNVLLNGSSFGHLLVRGTVLELRLTSQQSTRECLARFDADAQWPHQHWSDLHDLAATSLLRWTRDKPGWGLADNSADALEHMQRERSNQVTVLHRGPEFVLVPLAVMLALAGWWLLRLSPSRIARSLRRGRASAIRV